MDIDENEGILFEFDSNYDEDFRFRYYWTPSGSWSQKTLPVMVKDPDLTEIAAADPTGATTANDIFSNWKADITTMLDAVTSRSSKESLSDVLDLESVANFLIVNNLACNRELQHPKSFYMYKEALGTEHVYHFGPVWDFDWAFTFDGYEGQSATRLLFEKDGDTAGATFFQCICKTKNSARFTNRNGRISRKICIPSYCNILKSTPTTLSLLRCRTAQYGQDTPEATTRPKALIISATSMPHL